MAVRNTRSTITAATTWDQTRPATALGARAAIAITPGAAGPARAVVTGELDLASAHGLTTALCHALDRHVQGIALDLSEVTFFDCAALHALERTRHHAERVGRLLALERSSAAVDLVLRLAESMRADTAGHEHP